MKNNVLKLLIIIMTAFILSVNNVFAEDTENQEGNNTNESVKNDNSSIKMSGQSKGIDYSDYIDKEPSKYLNPTLIGLTSVVIPGTGQMINGFYVKGAIHLGLVFAMVHVMDGLEKKPDYDKKAEYFGTDLITYRTKTMQTYFTLETLEAELGFYSAFDAFRDARRINEAHGVTYYQPVSAETTTELWLAPFNYENFLDPFVTLPLLYLLYDTNSLRKYDPYKHPEEQKKKKHNGYYLSPTNPRDYNYMMQTEATSNLAVGVGEETFFRGYLYPASAELTQSHLWGGLLESVIFARMHAGTGAQASQLEAFAMGSYFTYVSYRNDYTLGHGIALHSWWDTIISLSLIKQNKGKTKFDKKGRPIKETYNVANIGFTF